MGYFYVMSSYGLGLEFLKNNDHIVIRASIILIIIEIFVKFSCFVNPFRSLETAVLKRIHHSIGDTMLGRFLIHPLSLYPYNVSPVIFSYFSLFIHVYNHCFRNFRDFWESTSNRLK